MEDPFVSTSYRAVRAHGASVLVRSALALVGVAGLSVFAMQANPSTSQAHAASAFYYQRGYYLDNGWFCYGWSNGAYHCTIHWHRTSSGQLVSDNPAWVPNRGGVTTTLAARSTAANPAPRATASPSSSTATAGQPCHSSIMFIANISQWAVPPSCYGYIYAPNPANYVYRPGFGWCNWWPEVLHPNQRDILYGSEYRRSSVPTVGAAVYFAPGNQGASSGGHFAQVVGIAPGGHWVLVTEMNFTWRGGGWQKVDYRYIHVGPGVTFIS